MCGIHVYCVTYRINIKKRNLIRGKIDLDLLSHAVEKAVFPLVYIVVPANTLTSGVVGVCKAYVLIQLYLK